MASVRFRRVGRTANGDVYTAEFRRVGGLPRGPQSTAREMMEITPDPRRNYIPRGVDRNAPRRHAN